MKPRNWTIRPGDNDKPLAEVVAGILRASRSQAIASIHQGNVRVQGQVCRQPARLVRAGQQVNVAAGAGPRAERAPSKGPKPFRQKPSKDGPKLRIVYQDDDLVVVDKPAGVTTVRHADELAEAGSRAQRFLPAKRVGFASGCVRTLVLDGRIRVLHSEYGLSPRMVLPKLQKILHIVVLA